MAIRKDLPTRDRILKAARQLFQQRGYYAVGTAEILEAAQAPKGSMYHHFPGGKEQIAIAAVQAIHADLTTMLDRFSTKNETVAQLVRQSARGMAAWLKASRWREGTMLTSTAIGSVPDLPGLHTAIKEAFDDWRARLAHLLTAEGRNRAEALALAQTIVAALEGAMILARIDQDERVVTTVAATLARTLEQTPSQGRRTGVK